MPPKKNWTLLLLSETSGNKESIDVFCQFIFIYIYIYLFKYQGFSIISCRLVGSNDFGKKKNSTFLCRLLHWLYMWIISSGVLKFEPIPTCCAQPVVFGGIQPLTVCAVIQSTKIFVLMISGVFESDHATPIWPNYNISERFPWNKEISLSYLLGWGRVRSL